MANAGLETHGRALYRHRRRRADCIKPAFSSDGGLVAALQNKQVRIFNTDDGTTLSTLKPFRENVLAAALSDDGSLAATLETGTLKLWQADEGSCSLKSRCRKP